MKNGAGGSSHKENGSHDTETTREQQAMNAVELLNHLHHDILLGHNMLARISNLLFYVGVAVVLNCAGFWLYLVLS